MVWLGIRGDPDPTDHSGRQGLRLWLLQRLGCKGQSSFYCTLKRISSYPILLLKCKKAIDVTLLATVSLAFWVLPDVSLADSVLPDVSLVNRVLS